MIRPRTKHASNDPKGEDTNLAELETVFNLRMFKTMDIQRTWLLEFKDRPIITRYEPLNLNYIMLKEMADVRNHSSRAIPFGALLSKVFSQFRFKITDQRNQYISKGFSITMIKRGIGVNSTKGEDEGEEESSRQHLKVEENLEVPQPHTEETYEKPNAQYLQLQWKNEKTMHGEVPMQKEYPMNAGHPSQEGTSS
ncbi:hypothetical protein Acr_18g0006340 [Actinidia rufa]|uniref:Uncharacterized protein n=1 Tax=Actinidia rufa TaxID=165716 RepID=A0A7J0G6N9_9ERIC|nr:hypothetical protein Acr_18g0006340 [Actinidia rufa]